MPPKDLSKMLQLYGYEYLFSNSITQDACAKDKMEIFGLPEDNVKYANNIARELKKMGHL